MILIVLSRFSIHDTFSHAGGEYFNSENIDFLFLQVHNIFEQDLTV